MKKIFLKSLLALLALPLSLVSCDNTSDGKEYLDAEGKIYCDGKQEFNLVIMDDDDVPEGLSFNKSVSTDDITLKGLAKGKKVLSVEYVSETSLKVAVDGKVDGKSDKVLNFGKVVLSSTAMSNSKAAYAEIIIDFKPRIMDSHIHSVPKMGYYETLFTLPYGSYNKEAINDANIIMLSGDAPANFSLETDTSLKVWVSSFTPTVVDGKTYNNPYAKFTKGLTTLDKEFIVSIGVNDPSLSLDLV